MIILRKFSNSTMRLKETVGFRQTLENLENWSFLKKPQGKSVKPKKKNFLPPFSGKIRELRLPSFIVQSRNFWFNNTLYKKFLGFFNMFYISYSSKEQTIFLSCGSWPQWKYFYWTLQKKKHPKFGHFSFFNQT